MSTHALKPSGTRQALHLSALAPIPAAAAAGLSPAPAALLQDPITSVESHR
jgi:hypothetical protein